MRRIVELPVAVGSQFDRSKNDEIAFSRKSLRFTRNLFCN
jgi:hypothetical protein